MSNNSSNKLNVPQAKQGMEQFKMLIRQRGRRQPQERQAQMIRKMFPAGRAKFDRNNRIAPGHAQTVEYIATVTI